MSVLLLLSAAMAGRRVGLVIGARPEWSLSCVLEARWSEPEACQRRLLDFTDDDAWRAGLVLRAALGDEQVVVVSAPDASTAGLLPPLTAICPAAGQVSGDCIAEAVASLGEGPLEISVYISAHGTDAGLHLDDRVWRYEELAALIVDAAPEGSVLAEVLADACFSGRWRGSGPAAPTGAVLGRAHLADVEIFVDGPTPEVPEAEGGAFTRLVLSGLAGAADPNGDAHVVSMELWNYLESYRPVLTSPMVPTIRARHSDPLAPITAFTPGAGGAQVTLPGSPAQADRWRWLIFRVERVGDSERLIPCYDVSPQQDAVLLRIPPGQWRVWRVPYPAQQARSLSRYTQQVFALAAGDMVLQAGEAVTMPSQPEHWLGMLLPDPYARGALAEPDSDLVLLSGALQADPFAIPTPTSSLRDRFFGGRTWGLAGGVARSGALGRDNTLAGGSALLVIADAGGSYMLMVGGQLAGEVRLAEEPAQLQEGEVSAGYDRLLTGGERWRLGAMVGGSIGGVQVVAAGLPPQRSWSGGLDLGLSLTAQTGVWMLRLQPLTLSPRITMIAQPDGSQRGSPDPYRIAAALLVGRSL